MQRKLGMAFKNTVVRYELLFGALDEEDCQEEDGEMDEVSETEENEEGGDEAIRKSKRVMNQ